MAWDVTSEISRCTQAIQKLVEFWKKMDAQSSKDAVVSILGASLNMCQNGAVPMLILSRCGWCPRTGDPVIVGTVCVVSHPEITMQGMARLVVSPAQRFFTYCRLIHCGQSGQKPADVDEPADAELGDVKATLVDARLTEETPDGVAAWLRRQDLPGDVEGLCSAVVDKRVSGADFAADVDEDYLKELGVATLGLRKAVLKLLRAEPPAPRRADEPPPPPPPPPPLPPPFQYTAAVPRRRARF